MNIQGMTNNAMFTFGVGDTTRAGLQLGLSKTVELVTLNTIYSAAKEVTYRNPRKKLTRTMSDK